MPNNPYQYGNPVEPENFVGREPFVNQLATLLAYPDGRSIALVAGRRCGKTSLLFALADHLRRKEFAATSAYHPFPIYYDMKGRPTDCKDDQVFLRHLLVDVIDRHVSPGGLGGRPERAWKEKINLDNPEYVALKQADSINLYQFEGAIRYILETMEEETPTDAPVRLILLFDEVDSLLDEPWSDALFNKLRTLVSSGEMRRQARVVLSGSTQFLAKTSERGSPLWNILETHYLTPFDEAGYHTLVQRFGNIPGDVENAVLELGGGHPFLEQYLLYYLWENQESALTAESADDIVNRFFYQDGATHLQAWANAVDMVGLIVFKYLANKNDWVEKKVLYQELNKETSLDIDAACEALNFHCFVEKDSSLRHYRARCGLLQRWLEQNFTALLAEDETENAPKILSAALERIKAFGNVTVVMGDQFNQSGDFRNSIINIKSTLDKSKQSIAATAHGSPDLRQQIELQIEVVMGLLEEVPEADDETAESLAGRINQMVDFATETKPDKEFVQILSGRVVQEAAELDEGLPELSAAIDELNELVLQLVA